VYFCDSWLSGVLFVAATAVLFPAAAAYGVVAVVIGTATARALGEHPALIRRGFFGYNAALVGLAWAWLRVDSLVASLVVFAVAAGLTATGEALWLRHVTTGRLLLPSLSVPFVLTTWAAMALLGAGVLGALPRPPSVGAMLAAAGLTVTGMAVFSARLAVLAVYGALLGAMAARLLGVPLGVQVVSIAAFNAAPAAIALGGYFVVWGTGALGLATIAAPAVVVAWVLLREAPGPLGVAPLTAPSCLVTLLALAGIARQRGWARRAQLTLVPLVFARGPERALAWLGRQRTLDQYWQSSRAPGS
jgi:urea transporter